MSENTEQIEKLSEVSSITKSLLFRKFEHIIAERFYFKNEVTRDKVIHTIIESYREPQCVWITGPFASGKSVLARFIKNTGKNFIIIEEESRQNLQTADLFSQEGRGLIIVGQTYPKETDLSRIIEMVKAPKDHELVGPFQKTMIDETLDKEIQSLLDIFSLGE